MAEAAELSDISDTAIHTDSDFEVSEPGSDVDSQPGPSSPKKGKVSAPAFMKKFTGAATYKSRYIIMCVHVLTIANVCSMF